MNLPFALVAIVLVFAAWKTGLCEMLADYLASCLGQFGFYLRHDSGAWVDLPSRLKYRDFYRDVVETADGWMWAAAELKPISTDGFTNADWNELGNRINHALTILADQTWIQTILLSDNCPDTGVAVFTRAAETCPHLSLQAVLKARATHLSREAAAGRVVRHRLYVFIGRQRKPLSHKVPFRGLLTADPWVDLEAEDFMALYNDVIRTRGQFITAFSAIGGSARPVAARVVFELAYHRLNPERGDRHPAPAYESATRVASVTAQGPTRPATRNGADRAKDIPPEQALQILLGKKERQTPKPRRKREVATVNEELFPDSPREVLAFTPLEVHEDYFTLAGSHVCVISLHRLPARTFCGLMEALTRQAGLGFPYQVSTSFLVGDQVEWDERLERKEGWAARNLGRSGNDPNLDEDLKRSDIRAIRTSIKTEEQKIGELGLTISLSASDPAELRFRRDTVLVILRQMEGAEGVTERAVPLDMFFASLPCTPHTDFRRRPALSTNAVGLMPLTGGSQGVPESEATDVFQRADNGLFFWNPRSSTFASGMTLLCGKTGSGKSAFANRQRTTLLAMGHRGVTMDFGGSAYRVCAAMGGEYIDITDANKTRGLGLFDIRPKEDEYFGPDELNEEGLPRDRLKFVELLLETLCLDPTRADQTALEPELVNFLCESVTRTYANLMDEVPTIDNFIHTLRRCPKADRAKGETLAARLNVYAKNGSLGLFLNDQSEPISIENPYTVFDFRGAIDDKHMMLVASMAVISFINRLLRVGRHIPKFIDVDEFQVVSRYPRICRAIDQAMRTARKLNAHCTVASQNPRDFDVSDETRGVRSNCEVYVLFKLEQPEYAREVFELPRGLVRLLQGIHSTATKDFRDCVVVYPGGNALLRLRNGALDRRLLLGAGKETAEFEEAIDAIYNEHLPVHPDLVGALAADGLGANMPREKVPALF